jgi:hypothetical protein
MKEPLAVVTSSAEIIAALAKAREMRGLSNQFCDERGGLTAGHTDKVLGPTHTKSLSEMTLDTFMEMFAVMFIMVPNPEAEARMRAKWEGRDSSNVRLHSKRLSKQLLERAKPLIAKENGRKGGLARLKWPREQRVKMARRAIVIRWRRAGSNSARKRGNESQMPGLPDVD